MVLCPLIRPQELLEGFFWPVTVLYTVVCKEISNVAMGIMEKPEENLMALLYVLQSNKMDTV